MSDGTGIEWTGRTWNPVTGCNRVSEGCDRCYALTLAKRLKAMGNPRYQVDGDPRTSGPGFGLTLHPDKLSEPSSWRRPEPVFVNSMSDLFHDAVPDDFIAQVFTAMGNAPHLVFQILTKRPARMARLLQRPAFQSMVGDTFIWPLPNVWLGTSVENQKWAGVRIPHLLLTPAAVRFLSCEPLLGPIDLPSVLKQLDDRQGVSTAIDWVIIGGESGPGFRPMDLSWARGLRDQCQALGTALFFKQVGGRTPKAGGRELDRQEWSQLPALTPSTIVASLRRKRSQRTA